ncbi:MAG: hypothetical protein V1870_02745 [Candidatus Aenigmatarchaeota archaeon]
MNLPVKMIAIIVVILLVLVTVALFFISTAGSKMNQAEAERVFASQCTDLCNQMQKASDKLAFMRAIPISSPNFIAACDTKFSTRAPGACLTYCGQGCSITATLQEELCLKSLAGTKDFAEACRDLQKLERFRTSSCDVC